METVYEQWKNHLKHSLDVFRLTGLLHDVLKGTAMLAFFLFVFLFAFHYVEFFFLLTIGWKVFFLSLFCVLSIVLFVCFVVWPLVFFFVSCRLENDVLFRQVCRFYTGDRDMLTSVYNLAFHQKDIIGDNRLKEAAFVQKYEVLRVNGGLVIFPKSVLLRQLVLFISAMLLLFVFSGSLGEWFTDLKNYDRIYVKAYDVVFEVQNKDLNVEYGKSIEIKLKAYSRDFPVENVFICYGGGEFLMNRGDSLYTYVFEMVNNDVRFHFKTFDQQSDFYTVKVLPSPAITRYQVTSVPPRYSGLKTEVYTNTVDFSVLYGSVLKFNLIFKDVDTLYLCSQNRRTVIPMESTTEADFSQTVRESGEYFLEGSNAFFSHKNLLNFTVTCVPDLYPGIRLSEMQDTVRSSIHYFYGVIADDYGFSALRFNYSLNGGAYTVVPVNMVANLKNQEFYFMFDFAEFAGMDHSQVDYYFEVFDNDVLSGPKSTRSDSKVFKIPDLNEVFDYNVEVGNVVNSSLQEAEKLAAEIVSGVKELQKKMLDNSVDNWEKQQLSKDIVEKKEKLDKLLQSVKESNLKKSDLNKSFTGQDSLLLQKQQQIQDLLDKIMDDEMKKLMDEFSKLANEFSKEKFQKLDEKMKLSFDQMSEELDRNIELLKRFQIEEKHDLIFKQFDKLQKAQEMFDELTDNKSVDKDSLFALSEELKEKLDKVSENYRKMLEENKALAEPYMLEDFKQNFDKLAEDLQQQQQNAKEGKKDKKLSEKLQEEMEELSEKMEQQQKNFMNKSLPENDIEWIIQNILILSLSQEDLLKEFPNVQSQSLRYNELGRLQDLKRQEYKIVKDSLSVLAKSNLMLASLLSHKFYDLEVKFGLLPKLIQDNKRGELQKEQQYIITYLNDIALALTDALQKGRNEDGKQDGKSGGKKQSSKSGNGKSSSGDKQEEYAGMKKMQNGLKKQLEDLVSQMKKGLTGKPLQQGISNMIRENELFRKSLNDFISESGSLSTVEKQLLNEINRLLDDNIRDLSNYSVSNQLISRNNLIYNKLLMSEKASKEREEYEEKRRSQSATETLYEKPDAFLKFQKKSETMKIDFQKSDLKLNGYFKILYNNYYIKLGNE
ncbi:MAG: hypothetical protein K2O69_06620 [Odoribacter sp.]|nr:hypothetical protein [Odoribacter sp.]